MIDWKLSVKPSVHLTPLTDEQIALYYNEVQRGKGEVIRNATFGFSSISVLAIKRGGMGLGLGIPRRRRNPNPIPLSYRKAGGICLGFGGEGMSTYTTRVPYYLNHIASLKHCFMCNIFLQKKRRKPLCA